MNDRDKRRYDVFNRVQTFGKANAADFAAGSLALQSFAIIDQVIADLDKAKAGQVASADTTMATLLDAVKLDIQNITRTAGVIDLDEPGFADNFHPPKAYNPAALLTTTDAFLRQLASYPVTLPPPRPPRPRSWPNSSRMKWHQLCDEFAERPPGHHR